ncbi:MAG: ABC transporter permease [Acidimicrobiia bacterium]
MSVITALRVVEAHARVYRYTWRGSAVSTFLNPVLFLAAMGLGLGALVDQGGGGALPGADYLAFLAPGLLAASAMQTGAGDGSWPVLVGIKWAKTYHAALATPVGIRDLVVGHLGWVLVRLTLTTVVFAVVMAAFGAVPAVLAMAAVVPAIITGMAFAVPVTALAATLEDGRGLTNLFRFGIVPMFLFSGTFFPIDQLPGWLQPIAYLTPLWHGVELCRSIALGIEPTLPPAAHLSYLAALMVAGGLAAVHTFRRRLQP